MRLSTRRSMPRPSSASNERKRRRALRRKTAVIAGAVGLVIGIGVSAITQVPFGPEIGVVLGLLVGWRVAARRDRA